MSRRPDPIEDLELLSTALAQAVVKDDFDELMALLNEREQVIASLLAREAFSDEEVERLKEVSKCEAALTEMMEIEQQKVSQDLINLFASQKGHKAYRRAA